MRNQNYAPRHWTEAELAEVCKLRSAGMGYADIARKIGRNISSVWVKFEGRPKEPTDAVISANVPDAVYAERRRRSCLQRTTLTSHLCGDPLPGYSAADRK